MTNCGRRTAGRLAATPRAPRGSGAAPSSSLRSSDSAAPEPRGPWSGGAAKGSKTVTHVPGQKCHPCSGLHTPVRPPQIERSARDVEGRVGVAAARCDPGTATGIRLPPIELQPRATARSVWHEATGRGLRVVASSVAHQLDGLSLGVRVTERNAAQPALSRPGTRRRSSANPPIRLRPSAWPPTRIHAPDRRTFRDADPKGASSISAVCAPTASTGGTPNGGPNLAAPRRAARPSPMCSDRRVTQVPGCTR